MSKTEPQKHCTRTAARRPRRRVWQRASSSPNWVAISGDMVLQPFGPSGLCAKNYADLGCAMSDRKGGASAEGAAGRAGVPKHGPASTATGSSPLRPTVPAAAGYKERSASQPLSTLTQTSAPLTTRDGRPLIISIFPDDLFDLTSGYQDPHLNIPQCRLQSSPSSLPRPSGGQQQQDCGSAPISWDYALSFSIAGSDNSLLGSTPIPVSSSSTSLDSLTDNFLAPDFSFHNNSNWNTLTLPPSDSPHLLGNDTQVALGSTFFTTAEEQMNILSMSSGMGDLQSTTFSTPMMKGKDTLLFFATVN